MNKQKYHTQKTNTDQTSRVSPAKHAFRKSIKACISYVVFAYILNRNRDCDRSACIVINVI